MTTVGNKIRKMCNLCNTPKPQPNGAMFTIQGIRKWVCMDCKQKRLERANELKSLDQRKNP